MLKKRFILPFLALLLTCAVFTIQPLSSNDTFWHISCGQEMLKSGTVSHTDTFTFTNSGNKWINHEYLSDIIFALLDRYFGQESLTFLCLALFIIVAFLTWRITASNSEDISKTAIIFPAIFFLASYACMDRLTARPHIFSIVSAVLLTLILHDFEHGGKKLFWILPPLIWLWAQLHGGFLLGILFLVLFIIRMSLEKKLRKYAIIFSFTPILLLLGPYGLETFTFPLRLLSSKSFMTHISEWQPLFSGNAFALPYNTYLGILISCAGLISSFVLWKKKKLATLELVWIILLAVLALKMRRALVYPILISTIPITRLTVSCLSKKKLPLLAAAFPLPFLLIFLLWEIPTGPGKFLSINIGPGKNIPKAAVDFLLKYGIKGNVYNSYSFGAYLTYRMLPDIKVAIDSRNLVYSEDFFNRYYQSLRRETPFKKKMLKKADLAFFVSPGLPDSTPWILKSLRENPAWDLFYFDDTAFVFIKSSRLKKLGSKIIPFKNLMPDKLQFQSITFEDVLNSLKEARKATKAAPSSSIAWILEGRSATYLENMTHEPELKRKLLLESRFAFLKAIYTPGITVPVDTLYFLARSESFLGYKKSARQHLEKYILKSGKDKRSEVLLKSL